MMKKFLKILGSCVFATMIAACASSSPPRFYTLSSTTAPAAIPQTCYSVSVGPVSLPAVVDRPQIVVRKGPNQVSIDEFDRWASPLKNEVTQVIVANLVAMLGTTQVTIFPQATAADASYRVVIDILRFDSEPGSAATLDALWKIRSAKEGLMRQGRTTLTEPTQGGDHAALAAAHSRALGQMSAEIAGMIRTMEAQKP